MADFPVAIAEAVRALVEKLPLSSLHQLDELAGDRIRLRRLRRLVLILEEAQRIAEEKGISPNDMKVLADHVGLPWMERASLRDNEDLRRAWAHLFVTITTEENDDLHGICVRILGDMNPWDCRVLDHMVRNAVVLRSETGDGFTPIPVHDDEVLATLGAEQENHARTRISIDNLVRLGCLGRSLPAPIEVGGPAYATLREALAVTTTGVNLYCASTGQELESVAPVRSEDEIIDMLGLRDTQIRRTGSD